MSLWVPKAGEWIRKLTLFILQPSQVWSLVYQQYHYTSVGRSSDGDTCRPLNSAHLWAPLYTICGFLCTLHICEPHLYMARPASTSIQSRAKSICRTKDDILFTTVCATPRTISGRFLMILSCDIKSFLFHQVSSHLPIFSSILLHPLLTQSRSN